MFYVMCFISEIAIKINIMYMLQQQATTASRGGSTVRTRRRLESMLPRNDSLSSDPSDCTRPPPPRPHKHKVKKRLRQLSLSSSEDDENVSTTSECTSCGEEQEVESESISERGLVMGELDCY